jgi:D-threo-aldose 1-dehydrogenase
MSDDATLLDLQQLGRTGLLAPSLCIGTSALGSMPETYGYAVDTEQALSTLRAVFGGPIRFVDTSNNYGQGESERRIGTVLREIGGLPEGFLLSTKVDSDTDGDFSGARVRRSLDESCERLGLDVLPLVYLHDPERMTFAEATAPGGAVEALVALREQGRIGHLGVAGGPVDLLQRFAALGVFEAVITHNRFTLLDRSAEPLLDDCAARGIPLVNAAPFGSGILVKGPEVAPRYAYETASTAVRESAAAMQQTCRRAGVPLGAAALQFSLQDPRVRATIVGITKPERLPQLLELAATPIPDDVWAELERSTPPRGGWLG